jgi:3-oxoacyl-ACP reductase-like protein
MDPETAAMTGDADPEVYDSLDGQVALVTGATRGIGAEIAARLADLGATV